MTLRLVSQSTAPERRPRTRRKAAEAAVQLRSVDCRPDLYERLRSSWERRPRRRFGLLLIAAAAVPAVFALFWSGLIK